MKDVKAAVVGLGLGRVHLEVYQKDGRIGSIALCDSNEAVLSKAKSEFAKVGPVYTSLEKLLSEYKPDIISVVTPDHFHREHSVLCLSAGCNVLQTKPLATNLEDGRAIVEAAGRAKGKFMVAHERRFRPYFSRIKELATSGALGEVIHIRVDSIQDKRWQIARSPWYGTAESGRTALTGSGIHEVDLVCWLAADEIAEVYARGNYRGEMPYHAPTTVTSLFTFRNGIIGEFTISYQAHWPKGMPQINEGFSLIGSRGLVYGSKYCTDDEPVWKDLPTSTEAVRAGSLVCVESFITSVVDGTPVGVSGGEALRSLEVAVALNRSAETGEKQVFPQKP